MPLGREQRPLDQLLPPTGGLAVVASWATVTARFEDLDPFADKAVGADVVDWPAYKS